VAAFAASDRPRIALALVAGLGLLVAGLATPKRTLYLLVVWLVLLGLVRRLASLVAPIEGEDPLLLVGALGIAIVLAAAAPAWSRLDRSALATTVLALQALIVASALNPTQGSLLVGGTGLLFLLLPTLGFWIGRGLGDDATFRRLLVLVALLGVAIAAYGLTQTLHGFPSWDALWIEERGFAALTVGESVRPFGPFPSSAEYALFLGAALVACVALGSRASSSALLLAAVPLLATALFLTSTRGIVFALAGGLALMACARRRLPPLLAPIAVVLAVLIVSPLAQRLSPALAGLAGPDDLVGHQIAGLANPLDPESSTATIHLALIVDGLQSALINPIGAGAGSVTLAASKFGGEGISTEADPSNLAVALGLPGVLAYGVLVVLAFHRSFRLASVRGDALSLGALGLLAVTFLQWFTGGHYAVALLVWLTLGWLDRAAHSRDPGPAR
jgi:hypothetical protein